LQYQWLYLQNGCILQTDNQLKDNKRAYLKIWLPFVIIPYVDINIQIRSNFCIMWTLECQDIFFWKILQKIVFLTRYQWNRNYLIPIWRWRKVVFEIESPDAHSPDYIWHAWCSGTARDCGAARLGSIPASGSRFYAKTHTFLHLSRRITHLQSKAALYYW
jgi:hypothetical protein